MMYNLMSINQTIIMFSNCNIMSYITVASEQITSKNGELSIDVFSNLEKPDESKLVLNCNSYLKDGIMFNCPNGGIKLESKDVLVNAVKSKLQSKNISLETVDLINLSSLSKINISALGSISLSNENDGFFYDIDQNFIKITNSEENSKLSLDSHYIDIGSNDSNIDFNGNQIKFMSNDSLSFKNINTSLNLYKDTIELEGDVYIRGTLKFDKLETTKIKTLRLPDKSNKLEFGRKESTILDWSILGYHINGESELNYNNHSDTFTFKNNNKLSNIKAGGICITDNGSDVLYIENNTVNTNSINTNTLSSQSIITNGIIKCNDLEINGKKIVEHIGNIIRSNTQDLSHFIQINKYVLVDCNLNQNIFIDKDEINISGFYKNILWEGKINIRNITKFSTIKNIIFRNCTISIINCSKIIFEQCEFENCEILSNSSEINIRNCLLDVNTKLNLNSVTMNNCTSSAYIKVSEKIFITASNINSNDNIIEFSNNSVLYHITKNFIKCKSNVKEIVSSEIDVILTDNWITYLLNNKSSYEKNIVVSSKN